jgi:hypothetical protein
VLLEFCRKIVAYLTDTRHLAMNDLLRFKYPLAKAVQQKIDDYRRQAYAKDYQTFLFAPTAAVETRFSDGFSFGKRPYPAAWFYRGPYQFDKHFFGSARVGELDDKGGKGEEFLCAQLIDRLPQVKHWIRNLSGRPQTSFWLPTSTDRFYPDFVAELNDGRIVALEYKGAHLADTADTKEKRNIGQLWADKSNGKGLFLMAEKKNAQGQDLTQQITAALTISTRIASCGRVAGSSAKARASPPITAPTTSTGRGRSISRTRTGITTTRTSTWRCGRTGKSPTSPSTRRGTRNTAAARPLAGASPPAMSGGRTKPQGCGGGWCSKSTRGC